MSTIKGIASITNSNFMICLKFMAPVTSLTNVRLTFITVNLNIIRLDMTMQTAIFVIITIIRSVFIQVKVVTCGFTNGLLLIKNKRAILFIRSIVSIVVVLMMKVMKRAFVTLTSSYCLNGRRTSRIGFISTFWRHDVFFFFEKRAAFS